jgi:monofunctional biosynthetic peptidoglycan transglycosylase
VARFCVIATLVAATVLLAGVVTLRFVDPPGSMVMAARILKGGNISYSWVPLKRISRNLVDAVVTSEDAKFCRHWGVDWGEIRAAVRRAQRTGDGPRGASTIPMQTARNLFLWQRRSYFRKAIEIPLAYAISAIWPKHRVIEVYLNIAEWAPGIFGAEAAARKHFSRSAAKITPRQAAQMAAALPNPHVRNAGRPGPRTRRLANHIEKRVKNEITKLGCIYQQ